MLKKKSVVIVGSGPAGIGAGIKILERYPELSVLIVAPSDDWSTGGAMSTNQGTLQSGMLYAGKIQEQSDAIKLAVEVWQGQQWWLELFRRGDRFSIFPFGKTGAVAARSPAAADLIHERARMAGLRAELFTPRRTLSAAVSHHAIFRTDDMVIDKRQAFEVARARFFELGGEALEGFMASRVEGSGYLRLQRSAAGEARGAFLSSHFRRVELTEKVLELEADAVVLACGEGLKSIHGGWNASAKVSIDVYPTVKVVLSEEIRVYQDVSVLYEIGGGSDYRSNLFAASGVNKSGRFETSCALTDLTLIPGKKEKRDYQLAVAATLSATAKFYGLPSIQNTVSFSTISCTKIVMRETYKIKNRTVSADQVIQTAPHCIVMGAGKFTTAGTTADTLVEQLPDVLNGRFVDINPGKNIDSRVRNQTLHPGLIVDGQRVADGREFHYGAYKGATLGSLLNAHQTFPRSKR